MASSGTGGWSWEKEGRGWLEASLEGGRLPCLEPGLLEPGCPVEGTEEGKVSASL